MAQSNGPDSRSHQPRGLQQRSVRREGRLHATIRGTVEAILRTVVVGSGLLLIAIAVWHVGATTSLATLTAVLSSETTRWVMVVVLGCVLIVAASKSGSPGSGN